MMMIFKNRYPYTDSYAPPKTRQSPKSKIISIYIYRHSLPLVNPLSHSTEHTLDNASEKRYVDCIPAYFATHFSPVVAKAAL